MDLQCSGGCQAGVNIGATRKADTAAGEEFGAAKSNPMAT
jgi:hypothetical protein